MQTLLLKGRRPLRGSWCPPAAKNSVLPLLAATLLCTEPCTLRGVPRLADVDTSLALLAAVGADAARVGEDIVTRPVPDGALRGTIPPALAGAMRSSVFYLAPLLIRCGAVRLPAPGGCRLGPRPVDIHLAGLAAMGAQVEADARHVTLRRSGPLRGADFTLRLPSVGTTLTLMMAACCAAGDTVLRGAACEPEIEDMAAFLNACGAAITGAGTPVLVIRGGRALGGAVYTPLPDRITAATCAAAVAAAGGQVTVRACRPQHFAAFLDFLQAAGCGVWRQACGVTVARDPGTPLRGGLHLCAAPWPGFATDTAPLAAAVLLGASGGGSVRDDLFENRFACAAGFAAMGGMVRVSGRTLHILDAAPLHGAAVTAPDLRGGAALAVAALAAEGTTRLTDPGHIARGYADLAATFAALGADCRQQNGAGA